MIPVNREAALLDPCCHLFAHGQGYLHVGQPALPAKAAAPATVAKPPGGTTSGSWHVLVPPHGGPGVELRWEGKSKSWHPVLGQGIRIAFSPEYLAAHGWKYKGSRTRGN